MAPRAAQPGCPHAGIGRLNRRYARRVANRRTRHARSVAQGTGHCQRAPAPSYDTYIARALNVGMNMFTVKNVMPDLSLRTIFIGTLLFLTANIIALTLLIIFPIIALLPER